MIEVGKNDKLISLGIGIEKDGKLMLHKYEAFYAGEKGLIKLKIRLDENEKETYNVYKELRDKGYILRTSSEDDMFRVYRKGFRRGEDRTHYILRVITSKQEINKKSLADDIATASKMRKELVYAFAGEKTVYVSVFRRNFP